MSPLGLQPDLLQVLLGALLLWPCVFVCQSVEAG